MKNVITYIGAHVLEIATIIISIVALIKSSKVNNLEIKLKKYTLEEIEKNREAQNVANVMPEIVHYYDIYKIRLYNYGPAIAYNVDFELPPEFSQAVTRNKVPYEQLDYGASLYEDFTVTDSTPPKFKITISWEDKNGTYFTNKKLLSFE